MISSITSLTNPKIKQWYKETRDSKYQWFVIESNNLIQELARDQKAFDVVLLTQEFLDENSWIKNQDELIVVPYEIIQKLAFAKNPPQCICLKHIKIPKFEVKANNYLILDGIKDPGNLATIIRTAVAFNIPHLFLSKACVSLYNDKVLRATMGTIFNIKVNYYQDLNNLVQELEMKNIECIATCLDEQAQRLNQYQPKQKYQAIIMGNESKGIDPNALKNIKHKCYIEINHTNSLNVAIATGIILYQMSLWNK